MTLSAPKRALRHGQTDRLATMSDGADGQLRWYGVRTLFLHTLYKPQVYEERVTMWRAHSFSEAIELAEVEAREYEGEPDDSGRLVAHYLGLAQSFLTEVGGESLAPGDEVFSLMRNSKLKPKAYLDAFFETGEEHQGKLKEPKSEKKKKKKKKKNISELRD